MAIDLNKLKSRLETLKTTNKKNVALWKPETGKQIIRIVPNKHSPENPFVELLFHYGINNKTFLSPKTHGNPDPIVEFSEKLKKSGDKEDYKLAKKLEPKLRTHVPILVRGKESEGIKFWGFGKQVYQELLSIMSDPDYGDITDPLKGRDLTVEFSAAEGANYPVTTVRPKPNTSKVTDDKEIVKKITEQQNIFELFAEPSYEDLKAAFEAHLKSGDDSDEIPAIEDAEAPEVDHKKSKEEVATATDTSTSESSEGDLAAEFEKMWGENNSK